MKNLLKVTGIAIALATIGVVVRAKVENNKTKLYSNKKSTALANSKNMSIVSNDVQGIDAQVLRRI